MTSKPHVSIPGEMLEHQDFVRRLARSLIADAHAAEDLAQDVWTSAVARPPHSIASARAWLARVTRSLAAKRARGERRRRKHEARVRDEAPEADLEDAERAFELQREIADAVHRLDEPYRAVILLRYFKELSHAEIAEAVGAPVETVRTRLQRGRERLRARLDREHGGDRVEWMSGVALLLGEHAAPAAVAGATTGGTLIGGIAMGVLAKIALGAAAVAALSALSIGAWLAWPGGGGAVRGVRESGAAAPPVVELADAETKTMSPSDAEPDRVAAADSDPAAVTPAEPPAEPVGWFVRGVVRGLEGVDATEAVIRVTGITDFTWPDDVTATGAVAADGTFDVDLTRLVLREGHTRPPLHALAVAVDHPLRQRASVRLPVEAEYRAAAALDELDRPVVWRADIDVRPSATVEGRVVHEDGTPAGGALVAAWRIAAGAPDGVAGDVAVCDVTGAFRLKVAHDGEHAIAAIDDGMRPTSARAIAAIGEHRTLDAPLVLGPGAALGGRVWRHGRPLGDVRVTAYLDRRGSAHNLAGLLGGYLRLVWIDGAMERASAEAVSEEDGAWLMTGLRPGLFRMLMGGPPGDRANLGGRRPDAVTFRAPDRAIDLVCDDAVLSFECADELAQSGRGVMLVHRADLPDFSIDFQGRNGLPSFSGPPETEVTIEIAFEGYETWRRALALPEPSGKLAIPVDLTPAATASLALEITAPEGVAIDVLTLTLFPPDDGDAALASATVAVEDGVARFATLAPGTFRAVLRASDPYGVFAETYVRPIELALELAPNERARRAVELELGGRLGIFARDASGAPLMASVELRDASGTKLDVTYVARHETAGSFLNTWQLSTLAPNETYPNLAPGEYELHLWYDGFERKVVPVTVEAGRTVPVDVTLARR